MDFVGVVVRHYETGFDNKNKDLLFRRRVMSCHVSLIAIIDYGW